MTQVTPAARVDHQSPPIQRATAARWLVPGVLAVVGLGCLVVLAQGAPLEHDESVYALWARQLLGEPAVGIDFAKRGLGLPLLIIPGVALGLPPVALRLVGLAFLALAALAAGALARRLAGPMAGLVALVVVATTPTLVEAATELLTDAPAAALALTALAVGWQELAREDGPRRQLLAVGPLLAAAIVFRWGAVVPVAALALGGALAFPRALVRARRLALGSAALGVLVLLPSLIEATAQTGLPWGALLISAGDAAGAGTGGPGTGAVTGAARDVLLLLGGPVTGLVVLAGLALPLVPRYRRAGAVLVGTALLQIVLLASTPLLHRYVFTALLELVVAGSVVLATGVGAMRRWPAWPRRRSTAAVLVATAVLTAGAVVLTVDSERLAVDRLGPLVRGAEEAGARSDGDCLVLTGFQPQVAWYSGCAVNGLAALGATAGDDTYALLRVDGKGQPEDVEAELAAEGARVIAREDEATTLPATLYEVPAAP